jgi:hypothetical protein
MTERYSPAARAERSESTSCAGVGVLSATPVRHILRLIAAGALSEADVFVDLGSGLGHVPLLASRLTGVRSFGIEVEAAQTTPQYAQFCHLAEESTR